MAVDTETVKAHLASLNEYLNKIENQDLTLEVILGEEDVQELLDRRMQLCLENCIDIATHLAAGLNLPRRETAASVFLLLGKHKIISRDLAERMSGAAKFRNVLVHEYLDFDYRIAYEDLDEKLADLRQFAKEVVEFLEKEKKAKHKIYP